MYRTKDREQLRIENFSLPFEGRLSRSNRWVKLSALFPWDRIEEIYLQSMSLETGRDAIPARIAFGAIYIKEQEKLTDERTVETIGENPYMQFFLGLEYFHTEPLFDASMMVLFRKRFPVEAVAKINEYICTGKWPEEQRNVDRNDDDDNDHDNGDDDDHDDDDDSDDANGEGEGGCSEEAERAHEKQTVKRKRNPNTSKKKHKKHKKRKKNHGKLLLDATVAPADIKYPTDIDLLNQCREHLERAIEIVWKKAPHTSHKLPYSAKKARKAYLKVAKSKKWTKALLRAGIERQLQYVELALRRLEQLMRMVTGEVKFPSWLEDRLEVIPKVYAQQKQMFESGTNRCDDRIVSLSQPHVRPIVRGKRPDPTEFGQKLHISVVDGYVFLEQTCWSNFNEGGDLIACVEEYERRFGFYPAVILADRIYQTRENRNYCKALGIRLSGPPLGRRKSGVTEAAVARQQYRDGCERNAVEGKLGVTKRRYGLDLIYAKLDETSKTEAALNILAMNAVHRLRAWLAHFSRFFQFSRFAVVFQ